MFCIVNGDNNILKLGFMYFLEVYFVVCKGFSNSFQCGICLSNIGVFCYKCCCYGWLVLRGKLLMCQFGQLMLKRVKSK
jgi:hypothetical protein